MSDGSQGLIAKYAVTREDGRDAPGGDKERARYFVLDYEHDPLAQAALLYYARLARYNGYIRLAIDLETAMREVMAEHGDGSDTLMAMDLAVLRLKAAERTDSFLTDRYQRRCEAFNAGDPCVYVRDHVPRHRFLDRDYPSEGPRRREYQVED